MLTHAANAWRRGVSVGGQKLANRVANGAGCSVPRGVVDRVEPRRRVAGRGDGQRARPDTSARRHVETWIRGANRGAERPATVYFEIEEGCLVRKGGVCPTDPPLDRFPVQNR